MPALVCEHVYFFSASVCVICIFPSLNMTMPAICISVSLPVRVRVCVCAYALVRYRGFEQSFFFGAPCAAHVFSLGLGGSRLGFVCPPCAGGGGGNRAGRAAPVPAGPKGRGEHSAPARPVAVQPHAHVPGGGGPLSQRCCAGMWRSLARTAAVCRGKGGPVGALVRAGIVLCCDVCGVQQGLQPSPTFRGPAHSPTALFAYANPVAPNQARHP
jgi:hypothetical protein